MTSVHEPATAQFDRQWHILERWQEFEGESRANLLRITGIAGFYVIELCNYYGLKLGLLELPRQVDRPFHLAVTALAVAWVMVALGVQVCLRQRIFPASLKFISTGCDLLLLSTVLTVADGPRSPLIVGYFLIIALSSLRMNLRLVQVATVGAAAGYLYLLGFAKWFSARDLHVQRYQQLIVLLALVLTGITIGQLVRRVPKMARQLADRLANASREFP